MSDDITVPPTVFKELKFPELVSSAEPLLPEDASYWETFNKKEERPKGLDKK